MLVEPVVLVVVGLEPVVVLLENWLASAMHDGLSAGGTVPGAQLKGELAAAWHGE